MKRLNNKNRLDKSIKNRYIIFSVFIVIIFIIIFIKLYSVMIYNNEDYKDFPMYVKFNGEFLEVIDGKVNSDKKKENGLRKLF